MDRETVRRHGAVAVLALSAVYFAIGVLWRRTDAADSIVAYDFYGQFYPWQAHARRALTAGGWLWNPYQDCGQVFLANIQTALLYPVNWVFLLLPREPALLAGVVLNVLIAAVGMFQLCRTIGMTVAAALSAALAFQLGWAVAQVASWSPTHAGTFAWISVALWRTERLVREPSARNGIVLAAALALQILAGFPQMVVLTYHVIALRIAWALLLRQARARPLLPATLLGLLAPPLLAAVQLLPSLEAMRDSLWGAPLAADAIGKPIPVLTGLAYHLSIAGNPLVIVMAAVAAFLIRRVPRRATLAFYLLLAILFFLFHLGPGTLFFDWYARVPPGSVFRASARLLWITNVGVAVLVGFAVDAMLAPSVSPPPGGGDVRGGSPPPGAGAEWEGEPPGEPHAPRQSHLATGGGAEWEGEPPGEPHAPRQSHLVTGAAGASPSQPDGGGGNVRGGLLALAIVVSAAAVQAISIRGFSAGDSVMALLLAAVVAARRLRPLLPVAVPAVIVLNTIIAGQPPVFTLRGGDVYGAHAPLLDELRRRMTAQDRMLVVGVHPDLGIMPKSGTLHALPNINDYDPMVLRSYAEYFTYMRTGRPYQTMDDWYWLFGKLLTDELSRPMFDLTAARYLLVDHRLPRIPPVLADRLTLLRDDGGVRLYENTAAQPRARYVPRLAIVPPDDVLPRLADGTIDTRRAAAASQPPASGFTGAAESGDGTVTFVADTPERVVLEVHASHAGFLHLADAWAPGWRAHVDGAATEIVRANHTFRAVAVPAGDSEVVFTYQPASVRIGALVTLLSAAATAVLWIRGRGRGATI